VWRQLGDLPRAIAFDQQALGVFVRSAIGRASCVPVQPGRGPARRRVRRRADHRGARLAPRYRPQGPFLEATPRSCSPISSCASATRRPRPSGRKRPWRGTGAGIQGRRSIALQALGEAQQGLGQLPEAEETLRQAIEAARAVGNPDDEARALSIAAAVARARGRLTDARSWLDDALVCIERIRASLGGAQLRASLVSLNHVVYEDHVSARQVWQRATPIVLDPAVNLGPLSFRERAVAGAQPARRAGDVVDRHPRRRRRDAARSRAGPPAAASPTRTWRGIGPWTTAGGRVAGLERRSAS
jgi:tetratricopeptide (TPR) repeat protein